MIGEAEFMKPQNDCKLKKESKDKSNLKMPDVKLVDQLSLG